MKLIVGGYWQGKLAYVMEKHPEDSLVVLDGETMAEEGFQKTYPEGRLVVNRFHNWVRRRMADGGFPEEEIKCFVEKHPDCIIISDEVGNGIVPADALEREFRERTGRILVELAKEAKEVERIVCGIGQKIK